MTRTKFYIPVAAFLLCLTVSNGITTGQIATGGTYTLDQSVIAGGGGTSTGTGYSASGTAGDSAVGASLAGGGYIVKSGFWFFGPLGTTAAHVSVSGKVITGNSQGLRNAKVTLSGGPLTTPKIALTGTFGYFSFDDVEVGQTYVVTVESRRYTFAPQAISVMDSVTDLVFRAMWQN